MSTETNEKEQKQLDCNFFRHESLVDNIFWKEGSVGVESRTNYLGQVVKEISVELSIKLG